MCQLILYKPDNHQPTLEATIRAWTGHVEFDVALAYSPSSFYFAKVGGASLIKKDGGEVPLNAVYEARLFGERAELRWLHRSGGEGDAVLLADEPFGSVPSAWKACAKPRTILETLETQYVLWGTAEKQANGWTTLWSNRIGALTVPYPTDDSFVCKKRRLVLKAREYLEVREDGNVVVAEERLLGLRDCKGDEHG